MRSPFLESPCFRAVSAIAAFSRIAVRETCAFPRWGGELGKRLVHFIMAGHGGRYCEKSAGKWQLALAQGPELKSPSASRQISSAY